MKKLVFIGLIVIFLASSYTSFAVKSNPVKSKAKTEAANAKRVGPDCKVQFERKCYGGNPLVVLDGEILDSLDSNRFCSSHPITCSSTECAGRLNVLFGFLPGFPKSDSCLPARK